MRPGERFGFLVDPDTAGRMDRVVAINDGRVILKEQLPDGVRYEVEKT